MFLWSKILLVFVWFLCVFATVSLFFSINPDEVRWATPQQQILFYQFGKSENNPIAFAINLLVEEDIVYSVEFFTPAVSDEISSQRTKLFFLLLIAMADDTLDKEERESVLNKLGRKE